MIVSKKYENGLQLLYEKLPLKSVCFAAFVKAGAANETSPNFGVAHFLEHTLFKGTKTLSEYELAKEFEVNGISSNAATSKDYTCYYFCAIDEQFEKGASLIADMFFNSLFDEKAHDIERRAIIEEYNSKFDKATTKVAWNFSKAFFQDSCLENPTLGTRQSISSLTIQNLKDFYNRFYTAENVIISVSGACDLERVENVIEKYFMPYFAKSSEIVEKPNYNFNNQHYIVEERPINQSIMEIGFLNKIDNLKDYRKLTLFNQIFGSEMSSRLFERLRNQLGLCYSVYGSKVRFHNFDSIYNISIQANQKDEELALTEIAKEIKKIQTAGITQEEYTKALNLTRKDYIFADEDFLFRALDNVYQLLGVGKNTTLDEDLESISSISFDELNEFSKHVFDDKEKCLSVITKKDNKKLLDIWNNEF